MDGIPFDITETIEEVAQSHAFSIGLQVPGTELISATGGWLPAEAGWGRYEYRGVARCLLGTSMPGSRVRSSCTGSTFSLIQPADARTLGLQWPTATGVLAVRIDGGEWREFPAASGGEVLVASGLALGPHDVEVLAAGQSPAFWAFEGIRAWGSRSRPSAITGMIDGGPLLADVRAEITGPASFSMPLGDGGTGRFSFLVPGPGRYRLALSAPGWQTTSVAFDAPDSGDIELPTIAMPPLAAAAVPPRQLATDEPAVLVACGHCNTWGTEPAEWLARRVAWINAQRPHAVLVANEVNPAYVAGALGGLDCPWVITDGNHRHPAFQRWSGQGHQEVRIGPARIVTAGWDVRGESWREVLGCFELADTLRIVCAYEPFAPAELLDQANVRLCFYGHDLARPPYWTRGRTTFLRKVDAQTFYRIEIGPPHDVSAPIKVSRFVFGRDE